ncbi:ATP-binding cassette domain-containing protein [Nonomuraea rubra]
MWRRTIATIFQDFVHYELPVRDNIGFGAIELLRQHAGDRLDALVHAAAERAGADGVIAGLPDGLDTILSRRFPGGVDLSGGRWQRIALARAMAAVEHGAGLLILDEPTAQLDVRAEADLYDRFLDLTRDLTTILISHWFSTVRRADRIVVLDRGRIVEDGSHDELVAAGGDTPGSSPSRLPHTRHPRRRDRTHDAWQVEAELATLRRPRARGSVVGGPVAHRHGLLRPRRPGRRPGTPRVPVEAAAGRDRSLG